jgi:hypothetical protein
MRKNEKVREWDDTVLIEGWMARPLHYYIHYQSFEAKLQILIHRWY